MKLWRYQPLRNKASRRDQYMETEAAMKEGGGRQQSIMVVVVGDLRWWRLTAIGDCDGEDLGWRLGEELG